MSGCQYESRLDAYHDGELDAAASQQVEQHVAACETCARRLADLRAVSAAMAAYDPGPDITPLELARLHQTLEDADTGSLLRFSTVLATMAASVLIISLTWIGQAPPAQSSPTRSAAHDTRQLPQWERLAMGETPAAPVQSPTDAQLPETGVAAAERNRQTIDWMLDGLHASDLHESR